MSRMSTCVLLVAAGVLAACGGTDAPISSAGDAGGAPTDAGAAGDGATDGSPTDGSPGDGGACASLASGASDVYVDKRYAGASSTGVAACPFTTIAAGVAAAANLTGTRTVHVAGDVPALVYAETGAVTVATNVILLGDGPAKTKISASGTCGLRTCAVSVSGSGVLDGFTVVSPMGDGITTAVAVSPPVVRNVVASGSKGSGILPQGAVDLGPHVVASNNDGEGVSSTGGGIVHVVSAAGVANAFDHNGANGINVEGASLVFEGGTAVGNTLNGIRFGAAGSLTAGHAILGLVATGNATGVAAFNGQNLKVRSSTLLTNSNYGLAYSYVTGYTLDLGGVGDLGNNKLGGATISVRNAKAGIYLCHSRGPATQSADGDFFAQCPPIVTSLSGCDTAPGVYTDVAYVPTVVGSPLSAASCTVGP